MDLDLYLATHPYDHETTAEILGKYIYEVIDTNLLFLLFKVENPDVPAVEVIETTVHEDQHIRKLNGAYINAFYFIYTHVDLHPPPDEQVFVNIVQNNTENEGKLRDLAFSSYKSFLSIKVLLISQRLRYLLLRFSYLQKMDLYQLPS